MHRFFPVRIHDRCLRLLGKSAEIKKTRDLPLTDEEKSQILYKNAHHLLGT
jgi:hypothetical protein